MGYKLNWVLCAMIAGATLPVAEAQKYPERPVRIVVPFSPGGGTDNLTRILTAKLTESLGQPFTVDNRPGAGAQIGPALVAKAPPDGYTLLHVDASFTNNPSLYAKLPYDTIKDFSPISTLASGPVVMVVHPSVPVKTAKDLVALARARPGQINFATGGVGGATHLGMELFKSATKIDIAHIPYKGAGAATIAVLSGEVVMMFSGPSSVQQLVAANKLRAIAMSGDKRNSSMPQIPTFAESGVPGVDAGTKWNSLAPAGTPASILNTLSSAMAKALQLPDVRQRLATLGYDPIGSTPEEAIGHIRSEIDKWGKVIREANIRP